MELEIPSIKASGLRGRRLLLPGFGRRGRLCWKLLDGEGTEISRVLANVPWAPWPLLRGNPIPETCRAMNLNPSLWSQRKPGVSKDPSWKPWGQSPGGSLDFHDLERE